MTGSSGDGASGTPLAQESERPTGAPPVEPARLATLAEPFRGSPAARRADGAAGTGGGTVDPYDRSTPVFGVDPGSPDQGCGTASRS
ncbi:hypothetical protein [Streptomyces sp. NPDC057695]|uniref:hypothetical protein n=1 Tax=Streptomyces sp. NPDC057695 TaxID=3346217 RepID=UPI0036B21799